MTVFDRSWYGRVLVERVEEFATPGGVGARLRDDRGASSARSATEGGMLVKFWMHISPEEQLQAIREAPGRPAEELEDHRRRLAQPREAAALRGGGRGHARSAPSTRTRRGSWWRADVKRFARVKVIETVNAEIERGMRERGFPVPLPANSVRSGSRSPFRTSRSTSTQSMPRASASVRACGLIACAAGLHDSGEGPVPRRCAPGTW